MATEKVLTIGATGIEEIEIDTGSGGGSRPILSSATTFYVSPTGSDATGDGSVGNPWKTIQFAFDTICSTYELRAIATVKLANGTYTENVSVNVYTNGAIGTPQLSLSGHATDPTLTVINGSLTASNVRLTVIKVKFVNTGAPAITSMGSNILLSNCHIDQASTSAYSSVLSATSKGLIYVSSGTWTLGTVEYMISAFLDSAVMIITSPVLAGTPVWSKAGVQVGYGSRVQCSYAFGGVAATGKKFEADAASLIGVVANFPGSIDGTYDLLDSVVAADSGWLTPTLLNSWAASGVTPQYRLIGKRLQLRGQLANAVFANNNTVAFNLPAAYRPPVQFQSVVSAGLLLVGYGQVTVATNGDVTIRDGSTGSGTVYASINSITYLLD